MNNIKAIYIHIPFCISKCKYCDFFSVPTKNGISDLYITSLCNEIKYRIKKYNIKEVDSIYIGGGTPSLLSQSQLQRIFDTIRENTIILEDCEITIESNPDDISKDLIKSFEHCGINRISLGLQSFSDSALCYVSRRATSEINVQALDIIKENWKKDLSVDLICGLPKEDADTFLHDISILLPYKPDHISMYSLTIEDETPLGKEYINGSLQYDFDFADDLWLKSKELLKDNGYIHYEVSNFCLIGKECRHNIKYWNHDSYIGCGSGGAGSVYYEDGTGIRWTNIANIHKYCEYWSNFKNDDSSLPVITEKIDLETSIFEFFMMGMRKLSGVSKNHFENIFKMKIPEKIINVINKWVRKGLCEVIYKEDDLIYTLGHKGILYLNSFLEEII